jgi:hypothetical protein
VRDLDPKELCRGGNDCTVANGPNYLGQNPQRDVQQAVCVCVMEFIGRQKVAQLSSCGNFIKESECLKNTLDTVAYKIVGTLCICTKGDKCDVP